MVQAGSSHPLVTVIVATFNSAKTLQWTLQSIQKQDFTDFEVRVVGDCCTDNSEEVVSNLNDPRFHWKNLPQNFGIQSGPNNQGLKDAKGKYIAYLGHDDLWFPWHLSTLVNYIEEKKGDLVFSYSAIFGCKGMEDPIGPLLADDTTFHGHPSPPSSWLHKKEISSDSASWNCKYKELIRHVDREFWETALKRGKEIHFCPVLSVLKFPSDRWNAYRLTSCHPQEPYLRLLFNEPRILQIQILTDMAVHLNQQLKRRSFLRHWIIKIIELYGRDRFPLFYLFRNHFQKKRKKARGLRGLPVQ